MKRLDLLPRPEPLEARIAPAAVFTYQDVDGMMVTVTSSKGTDAQLSDICVLTGAVGTQQLVKIALEANPNAFDGTNLTIVKGTADDALYANVGFIDATGLDLGKVKLDGDLGRILAGDNNSATKAAKSLTVGSIGNEGTATQEAGGTLESKFLGALGKLTVDRDFKEASLLVLGQDPDPNEDKTSAIDARGKLGDIFIGGNLRGGAADKTGYIYAKGEMGNVKIMGSLLGNSGDYSASIISEREIGKVEIGGDLMGGSINGPLVSRYAGRIFSGGLMGSVTIDGSLLGGDGLESGNVSSAFGLGKVTVGVDVKGGLGELSGAIGTGGTIGKVEVTGSILGGVGERSGSIVSTGNMQSVKIGLDIKGGGAQQSGFVASASSIKSVEVGGSIMGGSFFESGAVGCLKTLGPVTVGGNVIGGDGERSGVIASETLIERVTIGGNLEGRMGEASGTVVSTLDVGNVEITGSILGGDGPSSGGVLAGAGIGKVTVGGDLQGGTGPLSGLIESQGDVDGGRGNIGKVTITGALRGGDGPGSGQIYSSASLAAVTIGAGIQGQSTDSGTINAEINAGPIMIVGDVQGGDGNESGKILVGNKLASLTITGSLIGGDGRFDTTFMTDQTIGQVFVGGALGPVQIGGGLLGGAGDAGAQIRAASIKSVNIDGAVTGDAPNTASIIAEKGDLGPITIAGDVTMGTSLLSAQIHAQDELKSLTVGGNLVGNVNTRGVISAENKIREVTVAGSITAFRILAGYDENVRAVNRSAQIGTVTIGTTGAGNWTGSDLVAGAQTGRSGADDGFFGTVDDIPIAEGKNNQFGRIASFIIKGTVSSTGNSSDHFGIVAAQIDAGSIAGVKLALTPDRDQINIAGPGGTTDLTVLELNLSLG